MTGTEHSDWAGYLQGLIGTDREFAQTIIVAAQLNIADLLTNGPRRVADLAERTGTHAPSLYRLLRYLASRGIFIEDADGRFSLTSSAEPLRSDVPNSIRALALWNGSEGYQRTWTNLAHSVRTGESAFEHVYGEPFFKRLSGDPELAQAFNDVMTYSSVEDGPAIVAAYDFSGLRKIVDVGGGHGALLALILDRYPETTGVLFDAPEVVAHTGGALERHVTLGSAEKVAGDFFQALPPDGDAYLLKYIIHDWDDDHAISILRNCGAAMAPNGKVLIIEMLVPEGNAKSPAKVLDITMLLFTGGRERTEKEYAGLLHRAGLRLVRTAPTASRFTIIEAAAAGR
jgi:hypothetical protein